MLRELEEKLKRLLDAAADTVPEVVVNSDSREEEFLHLLESVPAHKRYMLLVYYTQYVKIEAQLELIERILD